ncbi:Outer membrane scaffolding protein for murein synthesis, MipA/OmpV family [Sphingomonas guangdongensis]|uniref:Outer membrane scaffolding protein for murein synthesis, MipA/OmpV family n=1 Tax=Sphingomonas guangdongensis TaxID=1141890 RepID=A0A285QF84_9SPHN|nr:MipA/OmpV family protein [Sphingomonas guangdongensis]SOB80506.1 Outer membrane scaffolding protein for murein synthesis, MipA/OmpV family [Sphingomonas guangdongensis]
MKFLSLTLAGLLLATPAFAQEAALPPEPQTPTLPSDIDVDGDSLTIGAGAVYLPDYEGSDDYRFTPAPGAIGSYKGFSFQLAGNRLSVDVIPDRSANGIDFQAGPIGVVNLNRTSIDNIDDARIRALGEIDTAIELGGYVGIAKTGVITSPYDRLSISASYRVDVTDAHGSGIFQPSVSYLTPLSRKAAVGLFATAERVEGDFARTYYSVTPAQSLASGLPVFAARGGWKNYSVGALATVSLTGDLLHGLKIVGGGTYSRLLNGFSYSPVVRIAGEKSQWLGVVGLAYTF